jgi:Spy/CpxP family protein refolding chaperone
MNKAKLLLVLAFVVVCAAGAVVGTAIDRQLHPPMAVSPPHDPLGIGLTPGQSKQMKAIWSTFNETRHKLFTERRQYGDDRRAAFESLLTPEQQAQYKKIQADYDAKLKELDEQGHQAAEQAYIESDKILTPEQRDKLHKLRDRHGPGMGPPPGMGMPRPHHEHGGDHHRPMTGPATQPHGDSL